MFYNVYNVSQFLLLTFYFFFFYFLYFFFLVTLLPSFSLLRPISRMLCNMVLVICFKDTVMRYRYARWINLVWLIIVYLPLIIIIYYQRKDNRGSQTRRGMSAEGEFLSFLVFFFFLFQETGTSARKVFFLERNTAKHPRQEETTWPREYFPFPGTYLRIRSLTGNK